MLSPTWLSDLGTRTHPIGMYDAILERPSDLRHSPRRTQSRHRSHTRRASLPESCASNPSLLITNMRRGTSPTATSQPTRLASEVATVSRNYDGPDPKPTLISDWYSSMGDILPPSTVLRTAL